MRLLNAHRLHFEEFYDSDTPEYAILSHRWGNEEASFKEMRRSNDGEGRTGAGWDKIRSTCRLAIENNFTWVWIDTCCINKNSSAELTEAINSMFKWYAGSGRCYVYLSDIHWDLHNATTSIKVERLRQSSWFSRGWTLQELLAPTDVEFFDMNWRYIGAKNDMTHLLAEITKIDPPHLKQWDSACVAQKMSWASGRETSRVEDMAYSLLGLFDVNMPLLYGEGRKAFYRLQLEIIKQSDDESIFAWTAESHLSHTGMLAPWPDAFKFSGTIHLTAFHQFSRPPFAMTNKGLEMRIPESFMRKGGDDPHKEDPSNTREARLLTLHLNCFATRITKNLKRTEPEVIRIELEQIYGDWYRKAHRPFKIPHAIESERTGFWGDDSDATELDWRNDKEVTIYVRQRTVIDTSPRARSC